MTPATPIRVRYHASGHARFELPAELCDDTTRSRLAAALSPLRGVYRIDFYARQRKLSVRFKEEHCAFQTLAAALDAVAGTATAQEHSCCSAGGTPTGASLTAPARTAKQPGKALGLLGGRGLLGRKGSLGPFKESTVIEFFNDALVLFLIKLHWHMITQHWLREPWRYRYEWVAALYLIYLLVRSRRPKN